MDSLNPFTLIGIFYSIPLEVIMAIISHLEVHELLTLRSTSTFFKDTIDTPYTALMCIRRDFPRKKIGKKIDSSWQKYKKYHRHVIREDKSKLQNRCVNKIFLNFFFHCFFEIIFFLFQKV